MGVSATSAATLIGVVVAPAALGVLFVIAATGGLVVAPGATGVAPSALVQIVARLLGFFGDSLERVPQAPLLRVHGDGA